MKRLEDDVFLTVNEIAARLRMDVKRCREMLIHGERVTFIRVGRQYLIDKASYLAWEAERLHLANATVNRLTVRR